MPAIDPRKTLGLAAVIVALRRKMLPPELRALIPAEVLPWLERAGEGDTEAMKVLLAWLEGQGDKTVWQ